MTYGITLLCYSFSFCSWYNEHLKDCKVSNDDEKRIRIVLLTDDKGNREKAKKGGIISFTGMYDL